MSLPLWIPVLVGLGIGLYFGWGTEPGWRVPFALVGAAPLAAWIARRGAGAEAGEGEGEGAWRGLVLLAGIALALVGIGFAAAKIRAAIVDTPVLGGRLSVREISGRVAGLEFRAGNVLRLTLEEARVPGLSREEVPRRIRVTVRPGRAGVPEWLLPGSRVRLRAVLMPPPGPAAPGAHDFGRDLWFQGIGATGFGFAPLWREDRGEENGEGGLGPWLARLRLSLAERVSAPLPPVEGAIAAALTVGIRGSVPAATEAAWRDSGVAHILSISGLHVSLVAGLVFALIRGVLALVEPLALRHPIKKWAAGGALLAAFAYLLVSGGDTPTERSVLMAAIAMTGMMLDRPAISLRLVAWAALAILLTTPESLLNVGFQMSFAAVVALIAGFDALAPAMRRLRGESPGLTRRAAFYLAGVAFSTLLASTATAPFGLHQFNRLVNYGLLTNLVAVPLTGVLVMPAAMAAFALMPFGLEEWPLRTMGWGIGLVDRLAHAVADLPGAVTNTGTFPLPSLLMMVAGGLWLALWRRRWRIWGIVPVVLALPLALFDRSPDLLVDGDARLVLLVHQGQAWIWGGTRALDARTWLRRNGLDGARPLPERAGEPAPGLVCDEFGCVWRPRGEAGPRVDLVRRREGLEAACARSNVLLSLEPMDGPCRRPQLVIDRFDLWRRGAHALFFDDDGAVEMAHVAGARGLRPWVPKRKSYRKQPVGAAD